MKDVRVGLLHLFESASGKTEQDFLRENVELVMYADDVGLDEVWLAEHHFSDYGVMPSTQVFAAYLAARTKRIRIGTGVVVLPFHNPIRLAEEFAFIDVLSGGRLDLGIGRGYQPHEFEGYGIDFREGRERYDEIRQVVRMAWETGTVDFQGKYYRFSGVTPRPRPLQRPTPPMFGASFNPETIKFQAMQKHHLLFTPLLSPPEKLDEYQQVLRDQGEDPADYRIGGLAFVYVAADRKTALAEFEEPCMWYFRTFSKLIPKEKYPDSEGYYINLSEMYEQFITAYDAGQMTFADMVDHGPFAPAFLVGDPGEVRRKLDALLERYPQITDILCWTRLGGLDHAKVMRSMELLVHDVLTPRRAELARTTKAPGEIRPR